MSLRDQEAEDRDRWEDKAVCCLALGAAARMWEAVTPAGKS